MTKKSIEKMLKKELLTMVKRQRTKLDNLSKQPRFKDDVKSIFGSIIRWIKMDDIEAPAYNSNSTARDVWLSKFWQREPHLAGVLNSVIAIDKNRGWTFVGGRNQVRRYVRIMHSAENGAGWRSYFGKGALSYYVTDMGRIDEIGRDGKEGPMRALYNVDSARCKLTGNVDTPLTYKPKAGGEQQWTPYDYFRVTSMESAREGFHGLGYCALSRAIEFVKLMVAVYEHDQEKLGARAARGLLLLHNITEKQWDEAMLARDAKLDSFEQKFYGAVSVLASAGKDEINAKLIALSSLPEDFNKKEFVDLTMYGYALCFGYDPSEFWPVQYGAMGRGTETEVQHMKATGKGGMDHILGYQEKLQEELPESLQYEFEQRDEAGEILSASVMQAKIEAIALAYETGLTQFVPLISRKEARSLLAEQGVIPYEWTEIEEDIEVSDVEDPDAAESDKEEKPVELERDNWLSSFQVLRACELFPDEPIVRYEFPANRYRTIFESGAIALTPRLHQVLKLKKRQDEGEIYYEDEDIKITELDVNRAFAEAGNRVDPEMEELLRATEMTDEEIEEFYPEERASWFKRLFARKTKTTSEAITKKGDVHIHYHNDQIAANGLPAVQKRQDDEEDDDEEDDDDAGKSVVVNVPEIPVDVNLEATFYLKSPDEVVETTTFIEREPHDRKIQRTDSISKKRKS